jgi:hypothetical protein
VKKISPTSKKNKSTRRKIGQSNTTNKKKALEREARVGTKFGPLATTLTKENHALENARKSDSWNGKKFGRWIRM